MVELLRADGADIPVVVGGHHPRGRRGRHARGGGGEVYTPKEFDIDRIMGEIADLVAVRRRAAQPA